MQFVLIPFALCFLLYIRQENQYRFRAATALKITLTLTLTVCLTVALARKFSPVLLTAAVGMLLCAGGDFYLQYIRRDPRKFTKGIVLFSLGQICNIAALLRLAPLHWSAGAPEQQWPGSWRWPLPSSASGGGIPPPTTLG